MKYSRRAFVGRGAFVIGGVTAAAIVGSRTPTMAASASAPALNTNTKSKTVEFEQWLLGTVPA